MLRYIVIRIGEIEGLIERLAAANKDFIKSEALAEGRAKQQAFMRKAEKWEPNVPPEK